MSPAAELAGCAWAATGTAAARLPAASMPCRKPRRSFVLESIVVLALVYANGLYDNHAPPRCLIVSCLLLLWAGPRFHQVALYQVRIPNSSARGQAAFTRVYVTKDTNQMVQVRSSWFRLVGRRAAIRGNAAWSPARARTAWPGRTEGDHAPRATHFFRTSSKKLMARPSWDWPSELMACFRTSLSRVALASWINSGMPSPSGMDCRALTARRFTCRSGSLSMASLY